VCEYGSPESHGQKLGNSTCFAVLFFDMRVMHELYDNRTLLLPYSGNKGLLTS
jgi:hypothetical protein